MFFLKIRLLLELDRFGSVKRVKAKIEWFENDIFFIGVNIVGSIHLFPLRWGVLGVEF